MLNEILNSLNNQIKELKAKGYNLYDAENDGFYMKGIKYNKEKDRLEIEFKEE
jgi:hypothetical protein